MGSSASSRRLAARRIALALALALTAGGALPAQDPRAAGRPRTVAGRIVMPASPRESAVAGTWAILHRVGTDRAAPLDSMRTDAAGRYHFRYAPSGRDDAIYFVSATYGDIAYFTAPLRGDSVVGEAAEIAVYDTTTRPVALRVRGRHLVVSGSAVDGTRSVVEVYELSNDTTVALVSGREGRATWTAILPREARGFQVGQGDVPAQAASFADGQVLVYAPFPPGVKQLSYSYALPADAFPLSIPVASETSVLEVLLEDPAGTVEGPRLVPQAEAEIQGRRFRRWLAQDVGASAVLRIALPARIAPTRTSYIAAVAAAIVVGMAITLLVARARIRRRPAAALVAVAPPPSDDAARIAEEIAVLDEERERLAGDDAERLAEEYARRRGELKARLAEALAARRGAD